MNNLHYRCIALFSFFMTSFLDSQQVSAATIERIHVFSERMQKESAVVVVLPDDSTQKDFPTVYILHGYSGNPERTLSTDLPSLLEQADRYKTIYVLVDGNYNSWYLDSPLNNNSSYETYIAEELVDAIDKRYNTRKTVNQRGILGWSMGGYGALWIGLHHQDTFGIIGSVCGAMDFSDYGKDYQVEAILGKAKNNWATYRIVEQIPLFKTSKQRILFDCGTDDPFLEENRFLHHQLVKNNITHTYIEQPGGHTTTYWSFALEQQLSLFNVYLK